MSRSVIILRIVHGLLAAYLLLCIVYLYYAVLAGHYGVLLILSVVSLGIEGILVFGLNRGDCPLGYIQRRLGDDKPLFELIMPHRFAKFAIRVAGGLTLIPIVILLADYLQL